MKSLRFMQICSTSMILFLFVMLSKAPGWSSIQYSASAPKDNASPCCPGLLTLCAKKCLTGADPSSSFPFASHSSLVQFQSSPLSLVQVWRGFALIGWILIMVMLRQLSYAIKTQFKAPKAKKAVSLCYKGGFHAQKGSIIGRPRHRVENCSPTNLLWQ